MTKPRYLKKETLAKNILQSIWRKESFEELDWAIRMAYHANEKKIQKYTDQIEKFKELYSELVDDPVKFVEKYSEKATNKELIHKLLKENPDIFWSGPLCLVPFLT